MSRLTRSIILTVAVLCLIGFFCPRYQGVSTTLPPSRGSEITVPGFSLRVGLPISPWLMVERNLPESGGALRSSTAVYPQSWSWLALVLGIALLILHRRTVTNESVAAGDAR